MDAKNLNQENISNNKSHSFLEILKFTVIALAIIIPFRAYIAEPFIVRGESMDPTFSTGHYLIVDQVTYYFHDPKREDVIVFKHPVSQNDRYLIKRIIGLPGETLHIDDGKITIINEENPDGIIIDDSHVIVKNRTKDTIKKTLGQNEYFVMGDNRVNSSDSREWGVLESKYIVGRPILRLYPISKIGILPGV